MNIELKKYSSRVNNEIFIFDNYPHTDIPNMTKFLITTVEKLTQKAIYSQMTTDELKNIKKLINEILKERK